MSRVITLAATWFGVGYLRPAPGTWGTLAAFPLVFLLAALGPYGYMFAAIVVAVLAIWIAHLYDGASGEHDRSEIVIDEVAGLVVTMTWLPLTWQSCVLGFVLFRLLDVLKPPPINWIDRRLRGGIGVVGDDLVAGVIANAILQFVFVQTTWLGYQLIA